MTVHAHPRHHPHGHTHRPFGTFAIEHPYAGDWLLVAAGTLAALLLWYGNT